MSEDWEIIESNRKRVKIKKGLSEKATRLGKHWIIFGRKMDKTLNLFFSWSCNITIKSILVPT